MGSSWILSMMSQNLVTANFPNITASILVMVMYEYVYVDLLGRHVTELEQLSFKLLNLLLDRLHL